MWNRSGGNIFPWKSDLIGAGFVNIKKDLSLLDRNGTKQNLPRWWFFIQ